MNKILIILTVGLATIILFSLYFRDSNPVVSEMPIQEWQGFVRNINDNSFSIDSAQMLSGEKATTQGMQDAGCPREKISDCLPSLNNDFYIRNTDTSTSNYLVNAHTRIVIMPNLGSPEESTTTLNGFRTHFEENLKNFGFSPLLKLKTQGGFILEMKEIYTP